MQTDDHCLLFDHSLRRFFREAIRLCLHDPLLLLPMQRAVRAQNAASRTRRTWRARGVNAPALAIASVTRGCNLHCAGCYARAQHREAEPEMTGEELSSVIAQAEELGVGIMLLAGGEPLTRGDLLAVTARHPRMLFPLFTNGLLIDDALIATLAKQRHVIPVLSLEGRETLTDARRGEGVYGRLRQTMAKMRRAGILFGASLTVTRQNVDLLTEEAYARELLEAGCFLLFYVDYVPVQPGTQPLALEEADRVRAAERLQHLRAALPGLFVAFPGDEEQYGGCLAAGRGFVHISAEGRLEPCPFAPYSDVSLKRVSFREALASPLLSAIREAEGSLHETRGGCALWEKRDWVASLASAGAAAE